MTTHTGYVMTLANSIIGVSLLAMPYCFKQCGFLLALVLLAVSNITTRLACHFLVKSAVMCRRKSFEYVAYHAFGASGKLLVELGVIGFMLGTSVAFFVVMGDLAPAILSKLLQIENNDSFRTYVLLVAGIFIILPLSMLRNIESLAAISTVTMMFYLLLVIKVLTESFPHLAAATWPSRVNYWRPEGVAQCFPIFAMALSCQTQVFEILEVLPNPTLERMNSVVRAAVGLCTGLYIAVGFLGYVAYARDSFGGNILLSFSPSTSSDLFQLGFVISIALSFPIVVFPCRASLNSLLFKKGAQYQELTTQSSYIPDVRFKLLTGGIVGIALCTGLLIPSIEFVLGFVGSTIGVATCVIFPAAAFINISDKKTSERLLAKTILIFGIAAMAFGVYGNLGAAADRKLDLSPMFNSPPPALQLQIPKDIPVVKSVDTRVPVPQKEENPELRREPPVPMESIKKKPEESHELRREPPVPMETINKKSEESPGLRREPPVPMETIQKKPEESPEVVKKPPITLDSFKPDLVKEAVVAVLPSHEVEKVQIAPQVVDKKVPEKLEVPNLETVKDPQPKKPEAIHADAIAREELELKEDDTQQKKEEVQKEVELFKKLEEHKEEQKQLLKEQQNILDEIKSRDGDSVPVKPAEPINPHQFSDNIEKIQEVIDDLKERKQVIDKTKGEKIAEDKKKNADKRNGMKATNEAIVLEGPALAVKDLLQKSRKEIPSVVANLSVMPLPLLKKIDVVNPIVAGRDILGVKTEPTVEREKRDVDEVDGSCSKTEKNTNSAESSLKTSVSPVMNVINIETVESKAENVIKESKIVSPPNGEDLGAKMASYVEKMGVNQVKDVLLRREETRRKRRK